MEITTLLDIHSREELYQRYVENHDKVTDFWSLINRAKADSPSSPILLRCISSVRVLGFISSIVVIFLFIFSGCTAHHAETSQGTQQDTIIENKTVEMLPYEPQIWIDNFLSVERKDTLRVKLWSEVSHQFINEIPHDTTVDWWCWYQKQEINAVLLLNDIEPLYLPDGYALAQCYPITEGKKRAIVIVPYIAQPSYWVQCCIYTIKDNKWAEQKSFGVALWDDCGGRESLQKCLVKKNGRWMYADQFDIDIEPKKKPYHYLFD